MAMSAFNQAQVQKLESLCGSSPISDLAKGVQEAGLSALYATEMGRVVLTAIIADKEEIDIDSWHGICRRKNDPRCQVGHIESNLKSRVKKAQLGESDEDVTLLTTSYRRFMDNAKATTLIVDRGHIEIGKSKSGRKRTIEGVESRFAVDLSKFSDQATGVSLELCDDYIYANELVPDTDIFGSGFFITQNKVVTAAHVLDEIFIAGLTPEDVMFIRGHFVWETNKDSIEVFENQIYVLDEREVLPSNQIMNGKHDGDMAWVKVKPYYGKRAFEIPTAKFNTVPLSPGQPMYALGHGLGIPMKLAFNGKVQDTQYNNSDNQFTCDINVLPGSSGAPIFDAKTHSLVGFISGLHAIYSQINIEKGCANLLTSMEGKYSGVATYFHPFHHLLH